jgi:hypothetical protein
MRFSMRRAQAFERPAVLPGDGIAVFGKVKRGPLLLSRMDLEKLPGAARVPDVGAFAEHEKGKAVGFSALVAAADPLPGTLYVNFENREGTQRFSHFLAEIEDLGWIAYTGGFEGDGPFRLILPGIHGSRARMRDLAWIEFSDDSVE